MKTSVIHPRIMGLCIVGLLWGQGIHAQVVQLPSYRVFGIGSSVLVPDQGSAVLGGVNRASTGQQTRGWPWTGSSTRYGARRASSAGVHVTILDHREWDAAILAEASMLPAADTATQIRARRISRQLAQATPRSVKSSDTLSVEAKQREQQRQATEDVAARQLIAQGDLCHQRGQSRTARIFYRTAWRQSRGTVRDLARARLDSLAR